MCSILHEKYAFWFWVSRHQCNQGLPREASSRTIVLLT